MTNNIKILFLLNPYSQILVTNNMSAINYKCSFKYTSEQEWTPFSKHLPGVSYHDKGFINSFNNLNN